MYETLFEEDPSVRALFDRSKFDKGSAASEGDDKKAKQPFLLAKAVHAYAANIDNLEALVPAVKRITEKHVSVKVLPEHYDLVGKVSRPFSSFSLPLPPPKPLAPG